MLSSTEVGSQLCMIAIYIYIYLRTCCILPFPIILGAEGNSAEGNSAEGNSTEGNSTLKRLASSVRSNMDTSVNPCEDFYQFSCGGWERRHTISPTAISFTRFEELNQQNINSLRSVIESGKDGNVPAVCLAKQFYDACMNTGLLDEMGSQPLLQLVRATGGWNLIGASNSKYM